MPISFLTEEQRLTYGTYQGELTSGQLGQYFYFDDRALTLIRHQRTEVTRLGFAIQLGTIRFLGTYLTDPRDVPPSVIDAVGEQLGINNAAHVLTKYDNQEWYQRHAATISSLYGYCSFHVQPYHFRFTRWLYNQAWLTNERPILLFDRATSWLVQRKIILPGVTTLERTVSTVREKASSHMFKQIAKVASPLKTALLDGMLLVSQDQRTSEFDRIRTTPTRVSAVSLNYAIDRLALVQSYGLSHLDTSSLPLARVKALARYAMTVKAQTLARMSFEQRTGILFCLLKTLEAEAQDDAIDIFDHLLNRMLAKAAREGKDERLQTIKEYDRAVKVLLHLAATALSTSEDQEMREALFSEVSREELIRAVYTVKDIARDPDNNYYERLDGSYSEVRRFLPKLLNQLSLQASVGGEHVLRAFEFLKSLERRKVRYITDAPLDVVTKVWQSLVCNADQTVNRRFYSLCVLERLRDALHRRDIFAVPSERWCNPQAKLLSGEEWKRKQVQVERTLGKSYNPEIELQKLSKELNSAFALANAELEQGDSFRITSAQGRETLCLSKLEKLEEPGSLSTLRDLVAELLPEVDLPQLILEIDKRTGFTNEFIHISETAPKAKDIKTSICAVLLAEACNIGLSPLVREGEPALTRARLHWVQQNYIRAETLTAANARLVKAQSEIPLVKLWGGGEVASADGIRFRVPLNTFTADFNKKYFNQSRGITYYNFVSDQFTGIHGIVVTGTLRDSLYILDGPLEQQTHLDPTEFMTDTAAYSDLIFGIFWLLGYRFSPRIADLGSTQLWRMPDTQAGALRMIARRKIQPHLISTSWEEMMRVGGSLKLGKVKASELIRGFQAGSKMSSVARAISELGRIDKTIFLLNYISNETYQRRVLTQLNRQEARHGLAREVSLGKRGEIRQRYRQGQEDQLGALGLVTNMITLWNTLYIEKAVEELRKNGIVVLDEDISRLSPLVYAHINMLGKYSFYLDDYVRNGELRPLRVTSKI